MYGIIVLKIIENTPISLALDLSSCTHYIIYKCNHA